MNRNEFNHQNENLSGCDHGPYLKKIVFVVQRPLPQFLFHKHHEATDIFIEKNLCTAIVQ